MNPTAVLPSPINGFAIGLKIFPIPPMNFLKPDFFFLGYETMLLYPVPLEGCDTWLLNVYPVGWT